MKNKKLKARLLDGSVWSFPLEVLAKERALSYAAEGTDVYNEEYEYSMSSDSEMYDWIMNNTDYVLRDDSLDLKLPG